MEEADIVESIIGYYGLAGETLTFYFTVVSAYLVVAYLVGDKLERSQMLIISTLFIVMAGMMSYAAFAYMQRGFEYASLHESINPNVDTYANPILVGILPSLMVGGIAASLYFMWSVRRTKNH